MKEQVQQRALLTMKNGRVLTTMETEKGLFFHDAKALVSTNILILGGIHSWLNIRPPLD